MPRVRRQIPIFRECDAVPLQVMAFSSVRQQFEADDILLKQGLKGGAAFLILSGIGPMSGRATTRWARAGPGAMLGEVAMIGDVPYGITARASEPLSAARIDRACSCGWRRNIPDFGASRVQGAGPQARPSP
jgi:CRP-like cAMP-binding protein